MKTLSLRLAVLVGLLASASISGQEEPTVYLCVADGAQHFMFEEFEKDWASSEAKSTDFKYLIKRSPDSQEFTWEVFRFGRDTAITGCEDDFDSHGNLYCWGYPEVRFNRDHSRFILFNIVGYYGTRPLFEDDNDLFLMVIGECSPL